MSVMNNRGWLVNSSLFTLSNDQADMVGGFDITIPELAAPEGQTFSLGLMTSNSMTRALRLFVGTKVFVCNNGMATGEIVMKKKHTFNLNLTVEIEESLNIYLEKAGEVKNVVEDMKQSKIKSAQCEHILMQAGRQRILPWSRIGQVDAEYRCPTYADHDEKTSWGLYNAFTHIVKQSPALQQMDKMNKFRNLLPLPAVA